MTNDDSDGVPSGFSGQEELGAGPLEKWQMGFGDTCFAGEGFEAAAHDAGFWKTGLTSQLFEFVRFVEAQS